MKPDNPVLNGCLYKKIEAAERLNEITPFTTGRVQRTLLIGYGQAAQIVDLFIKLEIISIRDADGNRHALVSPREAAIRVIRYLYRELEDAEEEEEKPITVLKLSPVEEMDFTDLLDKDEDDAELCPVPTDSHTGFLRRATEIACSRERIGTSALQRTLCIGYGRAAKLMDILETLGIVGPDSGDKKGRPVLLSLEEALTRLPAEED